MVSNGHVFVSVVARGNGHLLDAVAAVSGHGVHVNVALQVSLGDEFRQLVLFRGFQFAAVFTQLRSDECQSQLFVDFFFGLAGHALVVFHADQAILVQGIALAQCPLPQRDIMVFGAGEVLKRSAE